MLGILKTCSLLYLRSYHIIHLSQITNILLS